MSIHLAVGDDGFPIPKCRYCGFACWLSAIGVPLVVDIASTIECTSIVNQFRDESSACLKGELKQRYSILQSHNRCNGAVPFSAKALAYHC